MSFFRIISLQSLIILNIFVLLDTVHSWGDKQFSWPQNNSGGELDTNLPEVRRKIVLYHNNFRSKVRPTASNMLLMSWHVGAAKKAQRYAEECRFQKHSEITVPDLGVCGQNLYSSSNNVSWFTVINSWFVESKKFTYGKPNLDLYAIGHFTQMVWATTHKLGCGVARCSSGAPWKGGTFYNYVCQYCPTGNFPKSIHYPYKEGKPCADCPNRCVSGTLCNNPCFKSNFFSNCDDLVIKLSESYCTQGYCNATCECKNEIYKNYPW